MIDVNGTRHHLVLGERDWLPEGAQDGAASPAIGKGVEWVRDGGFIGLERAVYEFEPSSSDRRLSAESRFSVARDRHHNWYWLERGGSEIWTRASTGDPGRYWPATVKRRSEGARSLFSPDPRGASDHPVLAGLVVTPDHYLVAAHRDRPAIRVFDLFTIQAPVDIAFSTDGDFRPSEVLPRGMRGVWVVDRVNARYMALDRGLNLADEAVAEARHVPIFLTEREEALPVEDRTSSWVAEASAEPFSLAAALSNGNHRLVAVCDAPGAAADGPGQILALTHGGGATRLHLFEGSNRVGDSISLSLAEGLGRFVPHHAVFVPGPSAVDERTGRLFVADDEGFQVYEFAIRIGEGGLDHEGRALLPEPRFYPLDRFDGGALHASDSRVYYTRRRTFRPLVEMRRPRHEGRGTVLLPRPLGPQQPEAAFDGREPGCIWHRLCFDACVPDGCRIQVESRAADEVADLATLAWRKEPPPIRRTDGSELPWHDADGWEASEHAGTWETLFQEAQGRYLQLRITLEGTGRATPRIRSARIHFPRFSYLREYLPAVFMDDPESASFIDRYLANIEGLFTVVEGRIAGAEVLFDPKTVPEEFLGWLTGWMGLQSNLGWSVEKRRRFLSEAPRRFRERGTSAGVLEALHFAFSDEGEVPVRSGCCSSTACRNANAGHQAFGLRIVERFKTRQTPAVVFGDPTELGTPGIAWGGGRWSPDSGAEAFDDAYRAFVEREYEGVTDLNESWGTDFSDFDDGKLRMPAVRPTEPAKAKIWTRFVETELESYRPIDRGHRPAFTRFLAARYATASDLNARYGLTGDQILDEISEAQVSKRLWTRLEKGVPEHKAMLADWMLFVTGVATALEAAHRFTVLVPVLPADDAQTQLQRLEVARSVVALEKPAHTQADVRLYWGAFRTGESRLGLETVLGPGARFAPMTLARVGVGDGHVPHVEPHPGSGRLLVGRDGPAADPFNDQTTPQA